MKWLGIEAHTITVPAQGEVVILVDSGSSFKGISHPGVRLKVSNCPTASSFSVSGNACDKESEVDCKEFCGTSEQTGTCTADGNKITCSCKGGKAPDSNCEERCLLCKSRVYLLRHRTYLILIV